MQSRPWTAYALRILCCVLLFITGYVLLASSTFAVRMRQDVPATAIALLLAALLGFMPLLNPRRFLRLMLVSAFLLSGIGGYWWTTIPWDEFVKDSGFPSRTPPTLTDYLLVAAPPLIAAFYAITSRASVLMADLKNRGADAHEIQRAAGTSFLSGAALLLVCASLAAALWTMMATGVLLRPAIPLPTGVPAVMLAAAVVTVGYAIVAKRMPALRWPTRKTEDKPSQATTTKARRASG